MSIERPERTKQEWSILEGKHEGGERLWVIRLGIGSHELQIWEDENDPQNLHISDFDIFISGARASKQELLALIPAVLECLKRARRSKITFNPVNRGLQRLASRAGAMKVELPRPEDRAEAPPLLHALTVQQLETMYESLART